MIKFDVFRDGAEQYKYHKVVGIYGLLKLLINEKKFMLRISRR